MRAPTSAHPNNSIVVTEWSRRGSNPQPLECHSSALPIAPRPLACVVQDSGGARGCQSAAVGARFQRAQTAGHVGNMPPQQKWRRPLASALPMRKLKSNVPLFSKDKPMKRLAILFVLLIPASVLAQPARRAMTVDDLFKFQRIADPQISPDGKSVVYAVGTVDMEGNRVVYNLWLASTDTPTVRKQLTSAKKSDRHPRWSPDSKSDVSCLRTV